MKLLFSKQYQTNDFFFDDSDLSNVGGHTRQRFFCNIGISPGEAHLTNPSLYDYFPERVRSAVFLLFKIHKYFPLKWLIQFHSFIFVFSTLSYMKDCQSDKKNVS